MTGIQPAQVLDLQDKARQGLQFLLNYMFANADQALLALAGRASSNAEQNLYFESMRELRFKRRGIENFFVDAVAERFRQLMETGAVVERESVLETQQSLDQLSLINENALNDKLAIEKLASRAEVTNQKVLALLGNRLAALLKVTNISVDDNPLGPKLLCDAFLDVCRQLEVDTQSKRIFSRLFERFVLADLASFYNQMLGHLPEDGAASTVPAAVASTVKEAAEAESSARAESGKEETTDGDGPGWDLAKTPLLVPAGKAPAMPRAVLDEMLQEIQNDLLGGKETPKLLDLQSATISLSVHELLNGQLDAMQYTRAMALPFDDSETIKTCGELFWHLLQDERIPAPTKCLLKLLHVPVLRAALKDSDLMERADHPARQLLNELTGACMGWTPAEDLDKDPLYQKLQELTYRLVREYDGDPEQIDAVLMDLQGWLKAERGMSKLVEQRTIDAESGRANSEAARQRARGLVADEMSGFTVPDPVRELLTGSWCDIIYITLLQDGEDSDAWLAVEKTTADLVESVQELESDDDRDAFLEKTPATMRALRRNLERLTHGAEQAEALVEQVEQLHLDMLDRAGSASAAEPAPATGQASQSNGAVDLPQQTLAEVDKLPPDSWVEFAHERCQGKARLLTRIPVSGKLLFVNRAGVKVGEWSREDFARAVVDGKARLIGSTRLADQAMRAMGAPRA